jgi:hypothetical protein
MSCLAHRFLAAMTGRGGRGHACENGVRHTTVVALTGSNLSVTSRVFDYRSGGLCRRCPTLRDHRAQRLIDLFNPLPLFILLPSIPHRHLSHNHVRPPIPPSRRGRQVRRPLRLGMSGSSPAQLHTPLLSGVARNLHFLLAGLSRMSGSGRC